MKEVIFSKGEQYIQDIQKKFAQGGYESIHILADFDRTLTKNFVGGEEKPSLVSVLRKQGILNEQYSKEAYKLFDTYHPIEIDPNVSLKEKKEKMQQWWEAHMQLLVDTNIKKKHIHEAIENGNLEFREGIGEFLQILEKNNIPLVIISANALGSDSIHDFFISQGYTTDNIFIISNGFIWNEEKAIGYTKPVIHTFNKDETVIEELPEIYNTIQERKNVLLLGDSLGDPGMVEGFWCENLIKIGFLNKKREELEKEYTTLYDVVICNDGDLSFPNTFLQNIG